VQVGHRAELWDVNKWLAEVQVKLFRLATDDACIRLADAASGELFAECPVILPLVRCVEPVCDSSRYFVIRVVDRESGNHAFIGLGFRERDQASDFNAALCDHASYIERRAAAQAMKEAAQQKVLGESPCERVDSQQNSTENASDPSASVAGSMALTSPITNLKLEAAIQRRGSSGSGGLGMSRRGTLAKTFSLMFDESNGGTVAALAPPPEQRLRGNSPMAISPNKRSQGNEGRNGDDEWGEFESA